MPDDEESFLALKTFLEELHASLCLLTDVSIANSILVEPALEFLLSDIGLDGSSDLVEFLPDFLVRGMETRAQAIQG